MAKNKKFDLFFSIMIPSYNGADVIRETLQSILSQSFDNFEIVISDDKSTDDTENIVKSFKDKRIKFFKHKNNLGFSGNMERGRKLCQGDILYLMGQDDILSSNALMDTYEAFKLSKDIGAVTRPYYWFHDKHITQPVRAKKQLNPLRNEIISIFDHPEKVIRVFDTVDQLSGLAYRVKYMDRGFHPDIFPCHIYPFASIFKNYPVAFLKDYNIAVRIASSQSRSVSWIYDKSPMLSWVEMMEKIFPENKFKQIKKYLIKDFITKNYLGLVQIRNYSNYKNLLREIWYLVKFRPRNLYHPLFWFFSLGTMIIPPALLIPMVDWYKKLIYSSQLKHIQFKYQL